MWAVSDETIEAWGGGELMISQDFRERPQCLFHYSFRIFSSYVTNKTKINYTKEAYFLSITNVDYYEI